MLSIIENGKELDREDIINKLVELHIDWVIEDSSWNDYAFLYFVFQDGWKGYVSYSDDELELEYKKFFDENGNKIPD